MHRDRVAALYDVHSWTGLVFAVLVFVVCASGAVAVFSEELDHWANPALRTRAEAPINVDIDAAIAKLRATGRLQERAFIRFPRALSNHYETMARRPGEPQARLYVNAETGELHESRQSYVFWYLRHLHVRLMSPFYGRVIVGVIGLAMLLSIVTGVLIHKHVFRDLFRMRWRSESGLRSLLSELHKWVGVWALAFHLMIATTGAWLGLEAFITKPIRAALADRMAPEVSRPEQQVHVVAPMVKVAPLVETARSRVLGLVPTYITLDQWGTTAARVTVQGNLPGTLIQEAVSQVTFSGVDGHEIEVVDVRTRGVWAQVRAALEPLHYGYFAGSWLKVIYLLMGLTPALLSLTGALIWFDRRERLRGAGRIKRRAIRNVSEAEHA